MITASTWAAEATHDKIHRKAQNSYSNGNWKDAYEQYYKLVFETQNDPRRVGQDFTRAWQCLRQLNRLHELDMFRERAIQAHSGNWRIVRENQTRYIGDQVASWQLDLDPDKRHWDKRVTVKFSDELKTAGAYLVVAKMLWGNTARIIVRVSDTVIIKKPLKNQMLYYVADAVTGKALSEVNNDFFEYRTTRIKGTKRYHIRHTSLKRQTNKDGIIILRPNDMPKNMYLLATATTGKGRLAFLGFSNVWYPDYLDREYNQTKTLIMTDRPVNGVYLPPKVISMAGKSTLEKIVVSKKDMPNFFVEAVTVYVRRQGSQRNP